MAEAAWASVTTEHESKPPPEVAEAAVLGAAAATVAALDTSGGEPAVAEFPAEAAEPDEAALHPDSDTTAMMAIPAAPAADRRAERNVVKDISVPSLIFNVRHNTTSVFEPSHACPDQARLAPEMTICAAQALRHQGNPADLRPRRAGAPCAAAPGYRTCVNVITSRAAHSEHLPLFRRPTRSARPEPAYVRRGPGGSGQSRRCRVWWSKATNTRVHHDQNVARPQDPDHANKRSPPAAVALLLGGLLLATSAKDVSSKASVARHDAQYHMLALLGATPLEIAGSFSPLQGIEDATSARSATSATRSW